MEAVENRLMFDGRGASGGGAEIDDPSEGGTAGAKDERSNISRSEMSSGDGKDASDVELDSDGVMERLKRAS